MKSCCKRRPELRTWHLSASATKNGFFYEGSIEEQYIAKIMPVKLEMALKYSRTRTFLSDLEILFRTVLGFQSPSAAWEDAGFDSSAQSLSKFVSRNSS